MNVPVIYHLDDDLFAVPENLGPAKYEYYNDPRRLAALRQAVDASDLVFTSTEPLAERLLAHGVTRPIISGELYCAVEVANLPAVPTPRPIIGYMGTAGHNRDLDIVVPIISDLLERRPELRFETFGTIAMPPQLDRFGSRVGRHEATADYDVFLERLTDLRWSVGLAPLEDTPFNRCKADTKWVEYSYAGVPTVASKLVPYLRSCSDGAGVLASSLIEWRESVEELLDRPVLRNDLINRARERLASRYDMSRLACQLHGAIARARVAAGVSLIAAAGNNNALQLN